MYIKRTICMIAKNERNYVKKSDHIRFNVDSIIPLYVDYEKNNIKTNIYKAVKTSINKISLDSSEYEIGQLANQIFDSALKDYYKVIFFNYNINYIKTVETSDPKQNTVMNKYKERLKKQNNFITEKFIQYVTDNFAEMGSKLWQENITKIFDSYIRFLYDEIHRAEILGVKHAILSYVSPAKTKSSNGMKYKYICSDSACSICSALNGQEFSIFEAVEGVNFPPIHPNCRCTIMRAGHWSGYNLTYKEWFEQMSKNKVSSLLIFDSNNIFGDKDILSEDDYQQIIALNQLYKMYIMINDVEKADAIKYQIVHIRQKSRYRGLYECTDERGNYLDSYHYNNKVTAQHYYINMEYLDKYKLLKHGGQGTKLQETALAFMKGIVTVPTKPLQVAAFVGSLFSNKIFDPIPTHWGPIDVIDRISSVMDLIDPNFNPGKNLKEGDVYIYVAPKYDQPVYGMDYYFRNGEFLYSINQVGNKVNRNED